MEGVFAFVEWLADIVDPLTAGYYAGLLAVVVVVINVLLRRWLSPGQLCLMWALVLARLLLPVAPSSPLSFENLLLSDTIESNSQLAVVPQPYTTKPQLPQTLSSSRSDAPDMDRLEAWIEGIFLALPMIWFVGGIGGLTWTLANHWRFTRRANKTSRCTNQRIVRLWLDCCAAAKVRRPGAIVVFDAVGQPAIMGLFQRTLLLPNHATELSENRLRMIMFHELAHVRRWDIAANWALVAIRTIHWWNPVYWLAASRFRNLREQACDAFVLQRMEDESVTNYSELLLELAQRSMSASRWRVILPASILGFIPSAFCRMSFRGRLKALRNAHSRRSRWHATTVAGFTLLLAACGLTSASSLEDHGGVATWTNGASRTIVAGNSSYDARPVFKGPLVVREYDVEKALARVADEAESVEEARRIIEATLICMFPQQVAKSGDASSSDSDNGRRSEQPVANYKISGNTLLVQAPVEQHEILGRMLKAWAESGLGQISVATRFLKSNRDLVSDLGISWQYLQAFSTDQQSAFPIPAGDGMPVVRAESRVDEYLPVAVCALTDAQTATLLDAAQQDARTNVLNAPKVTIFNGQEAMIADCTQRPFVIGVRTVTGELASANQPNVVVIEEGTRIMLRGIQSRNRKNIHLEARMTASSLANVATASARLPGGPVTIQLPRVNRLAFDIATDIADGQTLLISCLPTDKNPDYMYYLLTARNIAETDVLK